MDKQYEESRRQFEKYFEDFYGYHPTDSHDQSHVENIWHTWQHSRASIVVELPAKHDPADMFVSDAYDAEEVAATIRSIGLSIKGE
ncbi:TPA: hypothetical protein ACKP84_003795 [Serratia marcescens]|nr:hypothetical protein [Serratia marcescens]HEJ7006129.1 hypothetical protein [Serratia marcescens]